MKLTQTIYLFDDKRIQEVLFIQVENEYKQAVSEVLMCKILGIHYKTGWLWKSGGVLKSLKLKPHKGKGAVRFCYLIEDIERFANLDLTSKHYRHLLDINTLRSNTLLFAQTNAKKFIQERVIKNESI